MNYNQWYLCACSSMAANDTLLCKLSHYFIQSTCYGCAHLLDVICYICTNFTERNVKTWNRVDCQCSEKRSETHKRLERMLFNCTKQDKMHTFLRKSSFSKLCTTQKQTVHWSFASWMLAVLRKRSCLMPSSLCKHLLAKVNCLFLCCR